MLTKLWTKFSYTIILLVCSVIACFIIVWNTGEPSKEEYVSVTIEKGETLWEISTKYAGHYHMSKKEFISWVEKHNQINASYMEVGKELVIPVKLKDHQMLLAAE